MGDIEKTVTVNIVSRWDNSNILFSAEVDAGISENLRIRAAVEIGVKDRANLAGANLAGANLAALALIDAHCELWTPKNEQEDAA
jgi:uncharacterized protein YjbI with pentapeptide repeats